MKALQTFRSAAVLGVGTIVLLGTGCATKKHVRQVVQPVEARVGQTEKVNSDQASQIGELNNNVSRVDERAMDADRKAQAAGQAAQTAHTRADAAHGRADQAHTLAESTRARLGELSQNFENLDNYQMVSTEAVLFGLNKYQLTKEGKAQLDAAVEKIRGTKNYVLEIQGFTDNTGSASTNLELSQKRADSVVRYLTTQHNIPLRKISVLGIGEEDPNADNKTREGRKQARRVEIKVFALNLGATQAQASGNAQGNIPTTQGQTTLTSTQTQTQ